MIIYMSINVTTKIFRLIYSAERTVTNPVNGKMNRTSHIPPSQKVEIQLIATFCYF